MPPKWNFLCDFAAVIVRHSLGPSALLCISGNFWKAVYLSLTNGALEAVTVQYHNYLFLHLQVTSKWQVLADRF